MERLIIQIVCCFQLFALGSRKLAGLRVEAGVALMSDRDTELPPDHMTDHMTERPAQRSGGYARMYVKHPSVL